MTNQRTKNKKPTGIQIQQLFTIDYIEKLIESEQKLFTKFRLKQKNNCFSQQYRYQSEIQKFLSLSFPQRTAKIIKNSKHFMRDFDCFSVQKNSLKTSKNSQEKSQKHQDHEIIKRDIESIISVFAMYSQIGYYSKGKIIDATGWKRQKIRILLKGQVGIYEPTNKKSLINCIHKIKEQQDQHSTPVCLLFNNWVTKISYGQIADKKISIELAKRTSHQSQKESEKNGINQNQINLILGSQNKQNLTNQNCHQILTLCQIISPITPHKHSTVIQKQGHLLVPQSKSSSILNQILDSQTSFTAICLSAEAVLIELDFAIFRQILWLINNDEEKLYITCLMRKFQCLEYFEAQKYLKKKQNVIDYLRSKQQNINLTLNKNDPQDQMQEYQYLEEQNDPLDSALNPGQQVMTIEERKESIQLNKIQSLQTESSSLYFSIPYTGTPYLIVQGEVIIVINKVKQQKLIDEKYSLPRKIYIRHQLLKIYENDVFGVQAIGQQSQFSLRYEVRKDSKILKMNKKILKEQIKTIPGFQEEFNQFTFKRDHILEQILKKLSKQIEKQMINKYADNHDFKVQKKEVKEAPRQIIHFQKKEKDLKTELTQGNQMQTDHIDKEKSRNQTNKSSLSLPNIGKYYQTKRSEKYSENSSQKNKHIALTQRKKQKEKSPQISKINDVQYIGSQQYPELKRQLLEKLSLKQRKRYSAHHQKRLTVELLKEFNLVGFSKEQQNLGSENGDHKAFVQMRDPFTGVLLRRRSIPSIQHIEGSKNRQNIEKTIMRKIGLLTQAEKVKHNQKVVKSRKSQITYENLQEIKRQQQKRLLKFSKSLPKLQVFYSKQADIQYKNKAANKF